MFHKSVNTRAHVPHHSYMSLGHVAHVGEGQPPRTAAMCIRADAAELAPPASVRGRRAYHRCETQPPAMLQCAVPQPHVDAVSLVPAASWWWLTPWGICQACARLPQALSAPLWRTPNPPRGRPALSLMPADPRLHTFSVGASRERWLLALLDDGGDIKGDATPPRQLMTDVVRTMRASFTASGCNVVLCDALYVPVLELEVTGMTAGLDSPRDSVYTCNVGATMGLWSYNALIRAWEPVMEPWTHVIKVEANMLQQVRGVLAYGGTYGNALWGGELQVFPCRRCAALRLEL